MEDSNNSSQGSSVLLDFTGSFKKESNAKSSAPAFLSSRLKARSVAKPEPHVEDKENMEDTNLSEYLEKSDDPVDIKRESREKEQGFKEINAQLNALGHESLDTIDSDTSVHSFIRSFETVLGDLRENQRRFKGLDEQFRKMKLQKGQLEKEKESLCLQLQCSKQDISAAERKLALATQEQKKSKARHEAWSKELQITISKLEGQHKQRQAAANKRESEYERLKQRFHKLQAQRDKSIKRSMQLERPLEPQNDKGRAEEESLENCVTTFQESKVAKLMAENDRLRGKLSTLHQETLEKLQAARAESNDETVRATGESDKADMALEIDESFFALPAEVLCEKLESMQHKVIGVIDGNTDSKSDVDPEELRQSLDDAKHVILEQDKLLKAMIMGQKVDVARGDIDQLEDFEELAEEKHLVQKLKAELHSHQQALAEEAEKLEKSRVKLENSCFDSPRVVFDKSHPLSKPKLMVPATPETASLLRNLHSSTKPGPET